MVISMNKYKRFKTFEVVIPYWICEDINAYYPFKNKLLKMLTKKYTEIHLITNDESKELYNTLIEIIQNK